MNAFTMAISDGLTIAKRNTLKTRRQPDLIGTVVLLPIVMVLMFAYVFGNVIEIPGVSYKEFLLCGIFTMTMAVGGQMTGYGLTEDLQKGVVDRFRSLPMSSSAVLVGRTLSDMLMNVISLVVMSLVGLVVGWRIHTSVPEALLGFLLMLLMAYAFSWIGAFGALLLKSPESYNNIATIAFFPFAFLANTFVDPSKLPGPLRVIAEWNPVSAVTQASRELFGNTSAAMPEPHGLALQHPIAATLIWAIGLVVVLVPLASWRYRKAVSR